MSARIARGGPARGGAKPRSRSGPGSRSVSTRRAPKKQGLLESLGVPHDAARRMGNWLLAFVTMSVVIAAIFAFRLPQIGGTLVAEGVGKAGFTVRRIEPIGLSHVNPMQVYELVGEQRGVAMPLVDLAAIRAQLLRIGWVRDARVSRRLPDTLVIDIVERVPAAIWQNNQQLTLIDIEGVPLEQVRIEAMPDLPLVIGADANRQIAGLGLLLEAAPRLRPQIEGATWIGGRRWDLRFQSGETLTLPEGVEAARQALRNFAAMDQRESLLGRGFARIDMRDPRRTYIRISREPGAIVPALAPPDPGQMPADLARTT